MSPAHLLKVGLASLALLAVPAGIDTRALIVDGTGAAMGTATNPIVTSGSGTAPAAISDATANPTTGTVQNFPMVWNGTTWDRWKDMGAANAITNFAGVPAVAPMYLDTTGTPSVRRGVTAASTTSGITGIQVPGSGNLVWDATSFRPQLSDTAGRTVVGGASAATAAVAGNPLHLGVVDGSANIQSWKQVAASAATVTNGLGIGSVGLHVNNGGTNWFPLGNGGSQGDASAANGSLDTTSRVWNGTNFDRTRGVTTDASTMAGTGIIAAGQTLFNGAGDFRPTRTAAGAGNTGVSLSNLPATGAYGYNGSTADFVRNNVSSSIHASAVTGTGTVNTDVVNYNARFFIVHVNVTNFNGGTVATKLQQQDANGIFTDLPGATTGAVATPNTDIFLTVGPNTWPANTAANFYANFTLPRQIRVVTTVAAASVTFSNAYEMGGGF